MSETTEPLAGLEARYAALRQAARSEGGDPGDVLEALRSLEGETGEAGGDGRHNQ